MPLDPPPITKPVRIRDGFRGALDRVKREAARPTAWVVTSDHYILSVFDNEAAAQRYKRWADGAMPKKNNVVTPFELKAR